MKKNYYLLLTPLLCVAIHLKGQTTFSSSIYIDSTYFTVGYNAFLSDLDLDGDVDLLSLHGGDQMTIWYEQNENHFFEEKHIISYTTNANPLGNIYPTDMDHDGDPDILEIQNNKPDNLVWYENDGSGNFQNKHIVSTVLNYCKSIVANDLDADGDEDIILSDNSTNQSIGWIENLGNGNFSNLKNLLTSSQDVYDFSAVNLDANAGSEIIYRTQASDDAPDGLTLHYAQKSASGAFTLDQIIADSLMRSPLRIHDINMDNKPDIIAIKIDQFNGGPIVWFNNDGSAFGAGTYLPSVDTYSLSEVADFDQDGDNDILGITDIFSVSEAVVFRVFLNNGTGIFNDVNTQYGRVSNSLSYLFATDLDGDQIQDLVGLNYSGVFLFQNSGDGDFGIGERAAVGESSNYVPVALDINGDGKKDFVNTFGDEVLWYENLGNQSFARSKLLIPQNTFSENQYADLDLDGDLDLVCATLQDLQWYPNDGAGHFGAGMMIFNLYRVRSIRISDIDRDGDPDLLFYSPTALLGVSTIGIYQNDGAGNFSPGMNLTYGTTELRDFFLTDLNGDLYPDIYAHSDLGSLFWHKNNGTGQFGAKINIGSTFTNKFTAEDMDHDGDLDIITVSASSSNILSIFKNNGAGVFSTAQQQELIDGNIFFVYSFEIADLDNDGFPDVVLSGFTKGLPWLKNDGTGKMLPATFIDTTQVWDAYITDLDSDNDIDITSRTYFPSKFYWFENLSITGTSNPTLKQALVSLTPNPAVSKTQIKIESDLPQNQYLIEVQDLNGKTLNTYKSNDATFTLQRNGLPAGAYFVSVREAKSGKLLGVEQLIWN